MKTSARGIADLIFSEGERLKAYRDSVGVETIGVGHTAGAGGLKPVPGMTITHQQEMDLLASDLSKFEARVNAALGDVPQHVFDGAVSFDFNTGRIHNATWVKLYKSQFPSARASFMGWDIPVGVIGRRKREAALIFDGVYHSPPPASGVATPDATATRSSGSIASGAPSNAGAIVTSGTLATGGVVAAAHAVGLSWGWIAVVAVAVLVVSAILYAATRKG